MPDDTPLGTEIKKRLRSSGTTQANACKESTISVQSLSSLIKGATELNGKYYKFLIEKLGEDKAYWESFYPNKVNKKREALVSSKQKNTEEEAIESLKDSLRFLFRKADGTIGSFPAPPVPKDDPVRAARIYSAFYQELEKSGLDMM